MPTGEKQNGSRWGREMWAGLLGTVVICAVFGAIMFGSVCDTKNDCELRWASFLNSPANEIGDTLAGFASALAFLWIVVTVMLQSRELAAQREQLELQRKESARTASALEEQVAIQQVQREIFESEQRQRQQEIHSETLNSLVLNLRTQGAYLYELLNSGTDHPSIKEERLDIAQRVDDKHSLNKILRQLKYITKSRLEAPGLKDDLLNSISGIHQSTIRIADLYDSLGVAGQLRVDDLPVSAIGREAGKLLGEPLEDTK